MASVSTSMVAVTRVRAAPSARLAGRPVAPSTAVRRGTAVSGIHNGAKVFAFFKFRSDAQDAGIYGSQKRDDFDRDDVEHYFNYMGMLAVEGTYDKLEALLDTGIHAVDLLLLMAASEGDVPKIEELLTAGARTDVKDNEGRTAADRAASEEAKNLILAAAAKV